MRRLFFGLIIAAGAAAYSQSAAAKDVEWTQHGGNPNEQRYSKLNQVTADNIGQLGLACWAVLASTLSPGSPLVRSATRYFPPSRWSQAFKSASVR